MTPRFLAQENKMRLLLLFLFVALLLLVFWLFQTDMFKKTTANVMVPAAVQMDARQLSAGPVVLNDAHFMGLRRATADEVKAVLPEADGKPTLLEFSSRMCHDCQRLKPVVSQALKKFSGVQFKVVDVLEDQEKAASLLRIFKPVTVPILVFIGADGEIKNVLYNYQPADVVNNALSQLQTPNRTK